MNRRQFLTRALVGVPLVAAAAPALLELLAPRKTIFLAPRMGWPEPDYLPLTDISLDLRHRVRELYGTHQWPIAVARGETRLLVSGLMPYAAAVAALWQKEPLRIRGIRGVNFTMFGLHYPPLREREGYDSSLLVPVRLEGALAPGGGVFDRGLLIEHWLLPTKMKPFEEAT